MMKIAIGSTLLFLMFISCEKIRVNSPASIRQSFYLDGQYHTANEEIVINRNYRYSESELFPEKYCGFTFLLAGTSLLNNATEQYPLITFNISVNPIYNPNEVEPGCFCLPKTTASKLYQVLTSSSGWNENGSDKYLYCDRQPLYDYSIIYGADILSKQMGNNLMFTGHIDSMVCYSYNDTTNISNFNFDYFVPAI